MTIDVSRLRGALSLPPLPLVIVAACALIDADMRVLLAQRPKGKPMAGLWEFPGGKIENRETPEEALIRELEEELAIMTQSACLAPLTFASHRYDDFHLLMPLYVCRSWSGIAQPKEGQKLKWVRGENLDEYETPAADRPLIAALKEII